MIGQVKKLNLNFRQNVRNFLRVMKIFHKLKFEIIDSLSTDAQIEHENYTNLDHFVMVN